MSARRPRPPAGESVDLEGLVLSSVDSRDDRILRVLSHGDAIVPVIARGVRRPAKSNARAAILQPLHEVGLRLGGRPGADLATVEDARLVDAHMGLKTAVERLGHASLIVEALLHLVPDHAEEPGLHALTDRALRRLAEAPERDLESLTALFLVRLLDLSGVMPDLVHETAGTDRLLVLPRAAAAVVSDWRAGRWTRLPSDLQRPTLLWLERQVTAVSMRPLKARAFLDSLAAHSEPSSPPQASSQVKPSSQPQVSSQMKSSSPPQTSLSPQPSSQVKPYSPQASSPAPAPPSEPPPASPTHRSDMPPDGAPEPDSTPDRNR